MRSAAHHPGRITDAVRDRDGTLVANLPAALRRHVRGTPTEAFLRRAARVPPMTREEEIELATRARLGDRDAMDRLVLANVRLAVTVAKRFARRRGDFDDLLQAGLRGLVSAAPRFDPGRGRFDAFAVQPIWTRCVQAIDDVSRTIHWPLQLCRRLRKRAAHARGLNRLPPPDRGDLRPTRGGRGGCPVGWSLRQSCVKERYEWGRSPVRGEANADRDPARRLERAHDLSILVGRIETEISRWSPRRQMVFRRRFGLGTQMCESLGRIANDLGVTRERVRQIETRCVTRLRRALRSSEPVLFEEWIATLDDADGAADESDCNGADDE